MKKINKATLTVDTEPSNMDSEQIVEIKAIGDRMQKAIRYTKMYSENALSDIKENIYPIYITFDNQILEDEFLSLETVEERADFLKYHADDYTEEKALHNNINLLYKNPEETDEIIKICSAIYDLTSNLEKLDPSLFDAFSRYIELTKQAQS